MKKAVKLVVFSVNLLYASLTYSQSPAYENNLNLKRSIPTSPEAAMLGRFGDIPIGYYTGTADVSVPLYSIKEAGVEIPVTLRYHGSGIRVEDEATNVGLGWSLEPGGSIIQVINGEEDSSTGDPLHSRDPRGYAYLKANSPEGVYTERPVHDFWLCSTSHSGDSFELFPFLEQNEGQPDVFQYSFAGYSGKFYINPETEQVVLIDKQEDIDFSITQGGWVAKTMDGSKFYFLAQEHVTQTYLAGLLSSKTYKLTKVELNNKKIINFEYVDGFYRSPSYSETYHSDYPISGGTNANTIQKKLDFPLHYTKTLKSIAFDNVLINFNLENREDLDVSNGDNLAPIKRIASVDIVQAHDLKKLKTFKFLYNYFNSGTAGQSYVNSSYTSNNKRLKLLSVQEFGYSSTNQQISKPPYSFFYEESVQFPLTTSFSRDFWGYNNGQPNTKMIPDLSFFYYSGDSEYGAVPPVITTIASTNGGVMYVNTPPVDNYGTIINKIQGANRAPDSTKMKAGMLKKITYPTGGYTEFDYQANDFSNRIYPDVTKAAVAVQRKYCSDYNRSSDTRSYVFTLANSQNVTFNNIITRGPNTSLTFWDLQPSTITLTKTVAGVSTVIKTWQMFSPAEKAIFDDNYGTVQWTEAINLPFVAGAEYTVTTYLPDVLGPQEGPTNAASVSSNLSYQAISESSLHSSYGAGLRVSAIRNYSSAGQLALSKSLKYINVDNTTSGKIMSHIKPLTVRTISEVHSLGGYTNGILNVLFRQMGVWFISSESAIPISSAAQGNLVGYSRVEEIVTSNGNGNGKHVYFYNNRESDARPNVPDNPDGLNGKIYKEEIYSNASSEPIEEIAYSYINKHTSSFAGFKIMPATYGEDPCSVGIAADEGHLHKWDVISYPILSNWYLLSQKETKQRYNGNLLVTTENYNYNSKGQLITVNSLNSKGKAVNVNYLYPIDNPNNNMSSTLIAQGLYNSLQQQKTIIDGTEVSRTDINYRLENNQVVESNVVRANRNQSPYTEVSFDKYGSNKNLQQYTKNGPPSCLLWSYSNSKPIAEIRNVSFNTIQSLLGSAAIDNFANLPNPSKQDIETFLLPLSNLYITRYSYDSLVGLTSETDPKGMTTFYEYDEFQRLKYMKDYKSLMIKSFKYNYKQ